MNKFLNLPSIFRELFYVLSGALLIFSILEIVWPGIVLAYVNINWVLIFWLIIGIVLLVTPFNKSKI
ncbi:hypothetical protein HY798_00955 [Candidatus Falkowbacteria bacterium]|nr:hypothetical protein [Candidatus Falkowbacteria bacterium]